MTANERPLEVRGLCKHYPGFELKDVSFALEPGTITGFIGRNGAGKTTTLNSLLTYVRPDAGEVRFFGRSLAEDAAAVKQRLGFVSTGMTYYPRKKLATISDVTRHYYDRWDAATYERRMREYGLDGQKTAAELSNGMKIKYALALALSHGADLLILDEPTSGLDPVSRDELVETLLALRDEGKTVLFSTHITADLEKCADRVLMIRRGEIAADQPIDAFAGAYRLYAGEGPLPPAVAEAALGVGRTRDGHTALLRQEDAEALGLPVRLPSLDEIIVHLEKEGMEE